MLTAERLREILSYDPETGLFTRLQSPRTGQRYTGKQAGSIKPSGYVKIRVDGRFYFAHRLAWTIMTGQNPPEAMDHIDCNPSNNRWSNLREATSSQNAANHRIRSNNSSGLKGVSFHKHSRLWNAR